mgnify:CR=1 FL=1
MAAEFEELRWRQGLPPVELVNVGPFTVPVALEAFAEHLLRTRTTVVDGQEGIEPSEAAAASTWQRAVKFVLRASLRFWTTHDRIPPAPMVSADGDRGVDVVWRTEGRSLYLNVPEEPDNVVTFYGRDRENPDLRLRGEEDVERNGDWILGWLAVG